MAAAARPGSGAGRLHRAGRAAGPDRARAAARRCARVHPKSSVNPMFSNRIPFMCAAPDCSMFYGAGRAAGPDCARHGARASTRVRALPVCFQPIVLSTALAGPAALECVQSCRPWQCEAGRSPDVCHRSLCREGVLARQNRKACTRRRLCWRGRSASSARPRR